MIRQIQFENSLIRKNLGFDCVGVMVPLCALAVIFLNDSQRNASSEGGTSAVKLQNFSDVRLFGHVRIRESRSSLCGNVRKKK